MSQTMACCPILGGLLGWFGMGLVIAGDCPAVWDSWLADDFELPYNYHIISNCRVTKMGGRLMSVFEEVLEEEFGRSVRLSDHMQAELELLPKGSVRSRKIKGREYYYLNYREGDKVKSDYVPASDIDDVRRKIERRKELKAALKEQERTRQQIERALGRVPDVV